MKRDEIKSALHEIKLRLDSVDENLAEHMAQTRLVKASVDAQKEHFDFRHEATEKRLDTHDAKFNGLSMKVMQYVSIAGGIAALLKILI